MWKISYSVKLGIIIGVAVVSAILIILGLVTHEVEFFAIGSLWGVIGIVAMDVLRRGKRGK